MVGREVERRSDGKIDHRNFLRPVSLAGLTEVKSLVGDGAVELGRLCTGVHAESCRDGGFAGLLTCFGRCKRPPIPLTGEMYQQDLGKAETDAAGIVPIKWDRASDLTLGCATSQ